MFGLWPKRYIYSVTGNVRVERSTGKVFRKYMRISNRKISIAWKHVDYKTTHSLKDARPCPPDQLKTLLRRC